MEYHVIQDGATFYSVESGYMIYATNYKVGDYDLIAAKTARTKFEEWFAINHPAFTLVYN